jgi:hypothetical protein
MTPISVVARIRTVRRRTAAVDGARSWAMLLGVEKDVDVEVPRHGRKDAVMRSLYFPWVQYRVQ